MSMSRSANRLPLLTFVLVLICSGCFQGQRHVLFHVPKERSGGIYSLFVYKKGGVWLFDEATNNIHAAPLETGACEFLDEYAREVATPEKGVYLCFSDTAFSGSCDTLIFREKEDGGYWYAWKENGMLEVWLPSQIERYFKKPPESIFLKISKDACRIGR